MGLTISDIHRKMYFNWRREGLSHKEAIEMMPEAFRNRFIQDLHKSSFESHYGLNWKEFLLWVLLPCAGFILGMYLILN